MNSIKELKEQLGYEEIGLDDIFVFHCTQCGKCCIHREDILLSPKDLFHIAKKLKITPEVSSYNNLFNTYFRPAYCSIFLKLKFIFSYITFLS